MAHHGPEPMRGHVRSRWELSYGTDLAEVYRQVGVYTGSVLKGAKPADLPVLQSTKFDFVINLHTARALGIEVPAGVLSIDFNRRGFSAAQPKNGREAP